MEGYIDVVVLRHPVDMLCQGDGAQGAALHLGAGGVLAAAGRDLDNAVRLGFGQAGQHRVGGLNVGDVEGRVGIVVFGRGLQHHLVLLVVYNRHKISHTFYRVYP